MKKVVGVLVSVAVIFLLVGCFLDEEETGTDYNSVTEEEKIEEAEENLDTEEMSMPDNTDASVVDSVNNGPKLKFSTVDIDGNPVTEDIVKGAKVVMINFWEPWCGPCVGEMPGLQDLYDDYKEQGLLILGVFSTQGMDDDVREILAECNTSYPVIRCDSNLGQYMTDYVPTTVFADSEGNIISSEPIVGSLSYSEWEEVINEYMR